MGVHVFSIRFFPLLLLCCSLYNFCKTTSVIVPCYHKHAMYIKELLTAYEKQTVLPDEIVISVSQVQKIPNNILDELQQGSWLFSVTILSSKKQLFAGQNRNIAGTHAKGDILICQDADDVPHPQRVEIIKYFFEHYNIDFLMHQYYLSHEIDIEAVMGRIYKLDNIEHVNPINYKQTWKIGWITNGNIALTREVFDQCKWPADRGGQDVKFNKQLFKRYHNRLVIKAPIYVYRRNLSSVGGTRIDLKNQLGSNNEQRYPVIVIYNN